MKFDRTIFLPLLLVSTISVASEKSTLSFSIDNDGIFGVDQDYTNGIFLTYTSSKITPYPILEPFSLSYWGKPALDKFEFAIGHKMYTPSDITAPVPLKNDRPYAGYLNTEFNYISLNSDIAQRFNLTIGTTGENSLADQAQDIVHSITGSDDPRGWAYQVDDKVVGSIGYLNHFNLVRQRYKADTDWELSSVSEINAGNFRSDISAGVMFRWGADLQNSMGAANIDNENPFRAGMIGSSDRGWFLFTGIEARYRFNDITIEGDRSGVDKFAANEGRSSSYYDVTLENTQATAVVGFAWYNPSFGMTLTTTVKTPDYKEAKESVYGTGGFSVYAFF
ncbi:lipid A deacylase LpxR family protein [Vibrio sp. M260118]|uniref:lipid A deacylase LpxR family protein n=1 Tax=Vibrio sp. M260118 TaxID=3020896 RepID=UPI002F4247EF